MTEREVFPVKRGFVYEPWYETYTNRDTKRIQTVYLPYTDIRFCLFFCTNDIQHHSYMVLSVLHRSYTLSVFGSVYSSLHMNGIPIVNGPYKTFKLYEQYTSPYRIPYCSYIDRIHGIWTKTLCGTVYGDVYCWYIYERKPYTDRIRSVYCSYI